MRGLLLGMAIPLTAVAGDDTDAARESAQTIKPVLVVVRGRSRA